MSEVLAGSRAELSARGVLYVDISPDVTGRPRTALVVLDCDDQPRAYVDQCRHLPIPLDASRRYLSEDKRYLVCGTHGARFHVNDGMCESGPCTGLALYPLPLREQEGKLWVLVPT